MVATNQLIGGTFQDIQGNAIAGGTIVFALNQPAAVLSLDTGATSIPNSEITLPLDFEGDIVPSPPYGVIPNDILLPSNTFYMVTVYSSNGALVWGPNPQLVASTPSPFNIGNWVPGQL